MNPTPLADNERGAVLVIAVLVLLLLTILGISSTTDSTIDLQIAANERAYIKEFYVADGGWKSAVAWLNGLSGPPATVNTTGGNDIVRNYGDGAANTPNDSFPPGTEDGVIDGVPYWYKVTNAGSGQAPGSGKGYRKFLYSARSVANGTQEVEVRLSKIYKVGY
jgi:hypothetical protein